MYGVPLYPAAIFLKLQLWNFLISHYFNINFSLEEIRQLEFRPVRVKGTFLHDKEIYIGPRTFLSAGDASTKSSLMTAKSKTGYLVITPFKLENNE